MPAPHVSTPLQNQTFPENMEEHSLACRVSDLIRVLDVFAHAPADESYTVVASGYDPAVCSGAERVVNDAIE